MRIFLSWSGPVSRDVARALKRWIKLILPATKPWMSEDTEKGKLWFGEISKEIKESRYGVVCVTSRNRTAPWLLWEAGALYGGFDREQIVVPLLVDLKKSELGQPLSAFQAIEAKSKDEVTHWLKGMNRRLGDLAIDDDQVDKYIEAFWQELQDAIEKALKDHPVATNAAGIERTFKDAADALMEDLRSKRSRSIGRYQHSLDQLGPYLNDLPLGLVDESTLQPYKQDRLNGTARHTNTRKKKAVMVGTVNKDVQTVRQALSIAVELRWLSHAPILRKVQGDTRVGHTLTWPEQDALIRNLPEYARPAYQFALNTGLRRQEIVDLRWDQEIAVPERQTTMFIIPLGHRRQFKKVVALNSVAKQIVEDQRGKNPDYVFTNRKGKKFTAYGAKGFAQNWRRAGLPTGRLIQTGVENLRDTFEHRLRVAKVSQEDIEILKGSTKADALERNQAPPVGHMIDCLEKITERVESTIVQKHNVKSNLSAGSWADRRKWKGRRLKGGHLDPPTSPGA